MTSTFCEKCNNLLDHVIEDDVLSFVCNVCHSKYNAKDNDTLLYENIKEKNIIIFEKILHTAGADPVNLKVFKKCKKCSHNIAKQVRIGDDMTLVNICVKCGDF